MLRKLISKIRQTLSGDTKHTEAKSASKSSRPAAKTAPHRHEKRPAHAPRHEGHAPKHVSTHAPAKAAAHSPRATHATKPLPDVPKLDTPFTALGLSDRVA